MGVEAVRERVAFDRNRCTGDGVTAGITLLSEATRALVSVMDRQQPPRLVCITGLGAGDSAGHDGFAYDRLIKPLLLRTIYEDKERQEVIIKDSLVDWVIVGPTVLTDTSPPSSSLRPAATNGLDKRR